MLACVETPSVWQCLSHSLDIVSANKGVAHNYSLSGAGVAHIQVGERVFLGGHSPRAPWRARSADL